MPGEFAAVLTPFWTESRSRGYSLSEEQARASEKLPGPGRANGGRHFVVPKVCREVMGNSLHVNPLRAGHWLSW
jgi:hypothetical protein